MKRSQRLRAVCALACAGLGATVHVGAQATAPIEPTRLTFRAPAGCSSADDFAARVRKRSSRIRLVTDAPAARSLVVEIQQPNGSGPLRGRVTVVEPDGATRARQLKAAGCLEAVEALSLIATVTLDPDALSADEPEPEPAPEPPKQVEPSPPAAPPRAAPAPVRRAAPTQPREPYRVSFGLAAVVLFRAAPAPAPGASVSAAFELRPDQVFALYWRLSLSHAQRRGLTEPGGRANFAFTLPALDLCPLRLGPHWLAVRPCAYVSAGLLQVSGSGTLRDETHARLYATAGGLLALQLKLNEALEIIADGRAGAPFQRDEFAFDRVGFFRTPTPAFSAAAGVAGGFP